MPHLHLASSLGSSGGHRHRVRGTLQQSQCQHCVTAQGWTIKSQRDLRHSNSLQAATHTDAAQARHHQMMARTPSTVRIGSAALAAVSVSLSAGVHRKAAPHWLATFRPHDTVPTPLAGPAPAPSTTHRLLLLLLLTLSRYHTRRRSLLSSSSSSASFLCSTSPLQAWTSLYWTARLTSPAMTPPAKISPSTRSPCKTAAASRSTTRSLRSCSTRPPPTSNGRALSSTGSVASPSTAPACTASGQSCSQHDTRAD